MSIPIHFAGRDWPSKKSCADELGTSVMALDNWLAQGLTDFPEGYWPRRAHKFRFLDRDWDSISECVRETGHSPSSIRKWLDAGLDRPPRRSHFFLDREWGTIREIAEHLGESIPKVHRWLLKGLTEPPPPKEPISSQAASGASKGRSPSISG